MSDGLPPEEAAQLLAVMTGEVAVEGALRDSDKPRVTGILSRGEGDEENAVPVVARDIQDSGVLTIWDIETGAPSKTSRNMLPYQVRKLHPVTGKRMFTQIKPEKEPPKPTYMCLLHEKGPDRKEYDRLGFAICNKMLMTEFYVVNHMKARHRTEWETIERGRERAEKEIDRHLQRGILRGLSDAAGLGEADTPHRGRPRKESVAG